MSTVSPSARLKYAHQIIAFTCRPVLYHSQNKISLNNTSFFLFLSLDTPCGAKAADHSFLSSSILGYCLAFFQILPFYTFRPINYSWCNCSNDVLKHFNTILYLVFYIYDCVGSTCGPPAAVSCSYRDTAHLCSVVGLFLEFVTRLPSRSDAFC